MTKPRPNPGWLFCWRKRKEIAKMSKCKPIKFQVDAPPKGLSMRKLRRRAYKAGKKLEKMLIKEYKENYLVDYGEIWDDWQDWEIERLWW